MNQESAGCWGTILTIVLVGGLFGYFYLDRSDDKAIHYAEEKWEYYDIAPENQNTLISKIGPKAKAYAEAIDDENRSRADRAEWQIKEACKQYEIKEWIAVIDEISRSGKISCTANNIKFEISPSNEHKSIVLDMSEGDLIKFSGSKSGVDIKTSFADIWGVIEVNANKLQIRK